MIVAATTAARKHRSRDHNPQVSASSRVSTRGLRCVQAPATYRHMVMIMAPSTSLSGRASVIGCQNAGQRPSGVDWPAWSQYPIHSCMRSCRAPRSFAAPEKAERVATPVIALPQTSISAPAPSRSVQYDSSSILRSLRRTPVACWLAIHSSVLLVCADAATAPGRRSVSLGPSSFCCVVFVVAAAGLGLRAGLR